MVVDGAIGGGDSMHSVWSSTTKAEDIVPDDDGFDDVWSCGGGGLYPTKVAIGSCTPFSFGGSLMTDTHDLRSPASCWEDVSYGRSGGGYIGSDDRRWKTPAITRQCHDSTSSTLDDSAYRVDPYLLSLIDDETDPDPDPLVVTCSSSDSGSGGAASCSKSSERPESTPSDTTDVYSPFSG